MKQRARLIGVMCALLMTGACKTAEDRKIEAVLSVLRAEVEGAETEAVELTIQIDETKDAIGRQEGRSDSDRRWAQLQGRTRVQIETLLAAGEVDRAMLNDELSAFETHRESLEQTLHARRLTHQRRRKLDGELSVLNCKIAVMKGEIARVIHVRKKRWADSR